MRLVDLVRIDHRFEKSVNLLLDLNDASKLKLYIPTRSSIKLTYCATSNRLCENL